jgi:hypothetical protein
MAKLSERNDTVDLAVRHQGYNTNFTITTGETQMSKLRTVTVTLVDNNQNLKPKQRIVYQAINFVTEHNDERTIRQILMTGEVTKALDKHNAKRTQVVDKDILRNTGRDVFLEEVEEFDCDWQIVQVA